MTLQLLQRSQGTGVQVQPHGIQVHRLEKEAHKLQLGRKVLIHLRGNLRG